MTAPREISAFPTPKTLNNFAISARLGVGRTGVDGRRDRAGQRHPVCQNRRGERQPAHGRRRIVPDQRLGRAGLGGSVGEFARAGQVKLRISGGSGEVAAHSSRAPNIVAVTLISSPRPASAFHPTRRVEPAVSRLDGPLTAYRPGSTAGLFDRSSASTRGVMRLCRSTKNRCRSLPRRTACSWNGQHRPTRRQPSGGSCKVAGNCDCTPVPMGNHGLGR